MNKMLAAAVTVFFIATSLFAVPVSWTQGGFDLSVDGGSSGGTWTPYTRQRYILVPSGGEVTVTVARNGNMRDCNGDPQAGGKTRYHIGLLRVAGGQWYTPEITVGTYYSDDCHEYAAPFKVSDITGPVPVQIWNNHPPAVYGTTGKTYYLSNGVQVWLIPDNLVPGNVPPANLTNGHVTAGQLINAPAGKWPALYRDDTDRQRLLNAVGTLFTAGAVQGSGPYDIRGGGNYWGGLSRNCLYNALYGWKTGSATHLAEARKQLLGLFSVYVYNLEQGTWNRSNSSPSTDQVSLYGRELIGSWSYTMAAACVLGPNMAAALTAPELEAVNAHLYSFSIHTLYNALVNGAQYYTADGGINMFWDMIAVAAGWNWNVAGAAAVHTYLTSPSHNECTYFIDGSGAGQYAIRYCQQWDPSNKAYEGVGNANCTAWYSFWAQVFRQWTHFEDVGYIDVAKKTGLPALLKYARDHYEGKANNFGYRAEPMSALFTDWTWVPGTPDGIHDGFGRAATEPTPVVRPEPNPMRDRVTINVKTGLRPVSNESVPWIHLEIYDNAGTVIYRTVGDADPHTLRWDGTDRAGRPVGNGVYYYHVQMGNETFSGRIIKTNPKF